METRKINDDDAVKFHFFFMKMNVHKARLYIGKIEAIYNYIEKLRFQLNAISEKPTYIIIKIKEEKNGNQNNKTD